MPSAIDKQNAFQNAFQNAHQLQSYNFVYNEVGSQTSTFFALLLALILLVALIRSEARSRALADARTNKPSPSFGWSLSSGVSKVPRRGAGFYGPKGLRKPRIYLLPSPSKGRGRG